MEKKRNGSRRKEKFLHNLLAAVLWLCVLLPLILCIILFVKVGSLEKELKQVKEINAQAAPGSFEEELKTMALKAGGK